MSQARRPSRRGPVLPTVAGALLVATAIALLVTGVLETGPEDARTAAARPPAERLLPGAAGDPAAAAPPARTGFAATPAAPGDRVARGLRKPPRAGLLVDLDRGTVLWRWGPERRLPIASLTKMMTAIVAHDALRPDDELRISANAKRFEGSGVGLLPRKKPVRVEPLLYGLLLPSGNDAAIALAEGVSGTVPAFVARMNERARELGLVCTHFTTPSGIRDRGNRSCATDLAILAREVLARRRLARIVRTQYAELAFPIKGGKLYLTSTNPLLHTGYPGMLGIKTGWTPAAGRCFVAAARRGARRLAVVLLELARHRGPGPAPARPRVRGAAQLTASPVLRALSRLAARVGRWHARRMRPPTPGRARLVGCRCPTPITRASCAAAWSRSRSWPSSSWCCCSRCPAWAR